MLKLPPPPPPRVSAAGSTTLNLAVTYPPSPAMPAPSVPPPVSPPPAPLVSAAWGPPDSAAASTAAVADVFSQVQPALLPSSGGLGAALAGLVPAAQGLAALASGTAPAASGGSGAGAAASAPAAGSGGAATPLVQAMDGPADASSAVSAAAPVAGTLAPAATAAILQSLGVPAAAAGSAAPSPPPAAAAAAPLQLPPLAASSLQPLLDAAAAAAALSPPGSPPAAVTAAPALASSTPAADPLAGSPCALELPSGHMAFPACTPLQVIQGEGGTRVLQLFPTQPTPLHTHTLTTYSTHAPAGHRKRHPPALAAQPLALRRAADPGTQHQRPRGLRGGGAARAGGWAQPPQPVRRLSLAGARPGHAR